MEVFMIQGWIMWLIITALLIIVELLTGLVATFCLAVGCLVAMLLSLLGVGLDVQLIGLAIGTVVAFVAFAPMIKRWRLHDRIDNDDRALSNMDALRGREVPVIEAIPGNGGLGRVKVDGDRWQARTVDGSAVAEGERVKIVGFESIILEVEVIK